jgi:hypothetical protein
MHKAWRKRLVSETPRRFLQRQEDTAALPCCLCPPPAKELIICQC